MSGAETELRQQILHLWLHAAALDTSVAAWAFYDGTAGAADLPDVDPPYPTGVAALQDGWMLMQVPGPLPVDSTNGELAAEYVFERRVPVSVENPAPAGGHPPAEGGA